MIETLSKKEYIKLTPNEKRVLESYSPNLTAVELAELAHTNVQSVYRAMRKFKLEVKLFKVYLTEEQKQQIRELARPDIGVKWLSEQVNGTRHRVHEFLTAEGLPFKRAFTNAQAVPDESKKFFCWEDFGNTVY